MLRRAKFARALGSKWGGTDLGRFRKKRPLGCRGSRNNYSCLICHGDKAIGIRTIQERRHAQ